MTRVEDDVSLEAIEDAPTIGNAAIATDNAPEWDAAKKDGNAHYAGDQVPQDRLPNLSNKDAFSLWREQSPMVEDSSSSSVLTNDNEMEGDEFFTVSCHVARVAHRYGSKTHTLHMRVSATLQVPVNLHGYFVIFSFFHRLVLFFSFFFCFWCCLCLL